MKTSMSPYSRLALLASAIAFVVVVFVPIWGIYLVAPQYPEGLSMQIWAHTLSGDVDIINGLNHYIGMHEIHVDDFIEFKVLPYVFVGIGLFFLLSALMKKKSWLYVSFILFFVFACASVYDFWKWEYDYGHNLNPHAAIQVPGMVYQPPLIGFKQLLNFGAHSVPEIGGWLLFGVGLVLSLSFVLELKLIPKLFKKKNTIFAVLIVTILFSCNSENPVPIQLNTDSCSSCKMAISDPHFGAEFITTKGRDYKFDDLGCMFHYIEEQSDLQINRYFVNEYGKNNQLIDATKAWYLEHEALKSPMGGNLAAFKSKKVAETKAAELNAIVLSWQTLMQKYGHSHAHN